MLLHLQEDVGGELEKLINDVDEDCFLSRVVKTVKSEKSVKTALYSRKPNDSCIKMRPHMSNIEESLKQISIEITRYRTVQIIISERDLDYAYGQMKLSEEMSRQSVIAIAGAIQRKQLIQTWILRYCRYTHNVSIKN